MLLTIQDREWGTLTAQEMICHLKDFLSMALGERSAAQQGNWFMRSTIVPKFLLYVMPWPKGEIETPKEIDPKRDGSRPVNFSEDVAEVKDLLERFVETNEDELAPHPNFGRLSKRDWGRAVWRNFDHHLKQFGQ